MAQRATPSRRQPPTPEAEGTRHDGGRCSPRAGAAQATQLSDAFAWLVEPQALARAVVELVSDTIEVRLGKLAQIGALGEVLAQQPVRVLVRPALPGRMRIAKIHLDPGVDADLFPA